MSNEETQIKSSHLIITPDKSQVNISVFKDFKSIPMEIIRKIPYRKGNASIWEYFGSLQNGIIQWDWELENGWLTAANPCFVKYKNMNIPKVSLNEIALWIPEGRRIKIAKRGLAESAKYAKSYAGSWMKKNVS